MEQIFITNLTIEKVRHLQNISIPLSKDRLLHLILTGKNGSGKTSVLEALACYLSDAFKDKKSIYGGKHLKEDMMVREGALEFYVEKEANSDFSSDFKERMQQYAKKIVQLGWTLNLHFNQEPDNVSQMSEEFHYIMAYY
ncbi:MAG: AAA family ATPase, partial [Acetatifactor sp.]|nr:AAA family ATPase [Acetatifactor sp.]